MADQVGMDKFWSPVDRFADWLRHGLGPQAQLRLGVGMVWSSIPLLVFGFFSTEPFVIYEMSAAALTFAGIGVVITAETLNEVTCDEDDDDEPQ